MLWMHIRYAVSALVFEGVRHYIGVMREKIGYQTSMRQAHSRVAFAALDNLIANHYIQSMKTGDTMTFEEATKIVEDYAEGAGRPRMLLDGLEAIRDELSYCENDEDADMFVTPQQVMAYRLVCREMRKLFV